MFIKDLTEEQAIKLARIGTIESWIIEDRGFEAKYCPYDPEMWSDAREAYVVDFYSLSFASKIDKFRFTILPNLDTYLCYIRGNGEISLPLRNQYKLYQEITKLGLEQNATCDRCFKRMEYKEFQNNYSHLYCSTCVS